MLQGVAPSEALQAIGSLGADVSSDDDGDESDEAPATAQHVLVYCDADSEQRFAHDLNALRAECDSLDVKLLPEGCLATFFPDCEVGAIPPFGNLYNMRTFVDSALAEDEKITGVVVAC